MTPSSHSFPVSLGDKVYMPRIGTVGEVVALTASQNQSQQVLVAFFNKSTGRSSTERFYINEVEEPRQ